VVRSLSPALSQGEGEKKEKDQNSKSSGLLISAGKTEHYFFSD
jgi:hypothetical protein